MKVHFLGIGGSGASAAATLAQNQGFEVTGCDLEPHNEFTTKFQSSQLLKGHSASHMSIENVDLLTVTPAIFSLGPNNPELMAAKKLGIPVITWQQFVGKFLTKGKFVIAICGTHGKTTTTAMIAQMMVAANLDPTVLLGAINPKWGANFRVSSHRHPERSEGSKDYFVIEADEFNDNFLHHNPDITVVTNIEMDHPEYFKDLNAYLDSFEKFLLQTKQTVVANLLDKNVAEVIKWLMKSQGKHLFSDRGTNVQFLDFNKIEVDLHLKVPGIHNVQNAKAAMQVGLLLGINPETIKQSLNYYTGVGRRFEYLGKFHKALVYSDFGHHPTEIEKTMIAVRERFPDKKIWLVYQPHMFSRTKTLFADFVKVFQNLKVEGAAILDIYPSREIDTGLISSQQLVHAIDKDDVMYAGNWQEFKKELEKHTSENDIIFFMGAGDIDKMARELVA